MIPAILVPLCTPYTAPPVPIVAATSSSLSGRSTPGVDVLLHAARTHCSPDRIAPDRLNGVDWTWVMEQAAYHGIEPLLHDSLQRLGAQGVPASVRDQLAYRARGLAMRSMQQAGELRRIAAALDADGCDVIPIKGPVLAPLAYGNLAYRQCLDLDLLVRPESFSEVTTRLQARGYEPLRDLGPDETAAFIAWHDSFELVHPDKKIIVELHRDFFPGIHAPVLDQDEVWKRHVRIAFAGGEVRGLALEDLVIYLCAHGTKHRWAKLKWLADLAGLVHRQPAIDWAVVRARSRRAGALRMVTLGAWLAHRLLEAPFPQALTKGNGPDDIVRELAQSIYDKWLFAGPDTRVDARDAFWFHLRERERWRDRVPYLMHTLKLALTPSEADREAVRLPESLSALYYVVRPFRRLWELITNPNRNAPDTP